MYGIKQPCCNYMYMFKNGVGKWHPLDHKTKSETATIE